MLTFLEYINYNFFYETTDLERAREKSVCDREFQDLVMWYADHLYNSDEFLLKMDKILRKCYKFHLTRKENKIIENNIINEEELVNRVLIRIHNTIKNKIKNNELNYSIVNGLISTMIKRSFVDMVRNLNRPKLAHMVQRRVLGTDDEPRSLKDDPSLENIGIEDIMKVPTLTDREKFVLKSRADGKMNKDIAAELGVAKSYTVEIYNDAKRKIKKYYGF